ncbi:hypothetical protein B1987_27870 [Mycobacterium kansasii]|uniref:DUF2752 domain-containing protein n=1 Tax=Mycobacterium attenuatum TaxID=2341086 RepID=A0A498Q097_9MYCO|nr:DUF2752 domain-containing protein [Mycobacterium attenuatum]ORB86953.1 hypothetical protein B1987_27870 [Mycobacterium kansasii]VBA38469.1 hypothetical protein LAUMK136_02494 [Mycobacterium attenuatum]
MEPDPGARGGHARRRRHRYGVAGSAVLFVGALGYIGLVDPHRGDSLYPHCPFKLLTGWNCPACGGLRMTHDLLHGQVVAAINDNVFLLFLLTGIPILAGWSLLRRRHGRSVLPQPLIMTLAVATVAWTVLRNLPGFPLVPTVLGA